MAGDVCPWGVGYFIDNPVRRLFHDPCKILGNYLNPGMTVMDIGCGMGFFSIAMAKMVGEKGRIIAVDPQPQMLDVLRKRARTAGVAERIQTHQCGQALSGLTFRSISSSPSRGSTSQLRSSRGWRRLSRNWA